MTRSERKTIRREEAVERANSRETFLNKNGRAGYVQILGHLETMHPNGARKEKMKLKKIIKSIKE